MNSSKKPLIIGIGIVVGTIVLVGLLLFTLFRPKKTDDNSNKSQDVTSFYSPVAQASDSLTVNYGSDILPNKDPVKQQFVLLGGTSLPLSPTARDALNTILQDALLSKITPTYATAYVHVARNSIKCDASDNCKMNLYIDSPESYFSLNLRTVNGIPSYDITQIPWEGIN
jgi:hypothetical protein